MTRLLVPACVDLELSGRNATDVPPTIGVLTADKVAHLAIAAWLPSLHSAMILLASAGNKNYSLPRSDPTFIPY